MPRSHRPSLVALRLVALLSLFAVAATPGCNHTPAEQPAARASYVGRTACAECHQAEAQAWADSDHALAMQPADATTVLGDFNNARFTSNLGITTTFSR